MYQQQQQSFVAPATPRMPVELVQHLVIYLLGSPKVQSEAARHLEPRYFSQEAHFRLLWQAVVDLSKSYGAGNVPFDALFYAVHERLQNSDSLQPLQQALLLAMPEDVGRPIFDEQPDGPRVDRPGILYHVYHVEDLDRLDAAFGMDLLKRFLEERAVVDAVRSAVISADRLVPGDFDRVLDDLRGKALTARTLGHKTWSGIEDFSIESIVMNVQPTGVPFIDEMLEGGHVPGEVYMNLGPEKGGKSFLAVQVCVCCAEQAYQASAQGQEPRYAYYFSYELSRQEAWARIISCGADISLHRLMYEIRQESDLSTRGNLLPYEIEYYKARKMTNLTELPGEKERLAAYKAGPGKYVIVNDFRGQSAEGAAHTGSGGIEEIVAFLSQMKREGKAPSMVVIDYTNRVVEAQITATGGNVARDLRPNIIRFVRECFRKLAVPFDIPVWLIQQYNADANSSSPTKALSIAQGAEARTVGAEVSAAFCLGKRDEQTDVAQFRLDRSRRTKNQGETRLLQMNGNLARWREVTGEYECIFDGSDSGRILKKGAAAASHQVDAKAAQVLAAGPKEPVDPYQLEKTAQKKGGKGKKGGAPDSGAWGPTP